MKVLILTGRFGMGHVSVAKSLEEQILSEYKDISAEVVDLMEYTAPRAAGFIYGAFGFLARHGRSLYNFIYKQAGKRDESEWTAFTAFSMSRLTALMEEKKPDVVISTLPLCSLLVSKYKERAAKKSPGSAAAAITLATCITDISSHSEWLQPNTDFYLVGDELVKRQLVSKGVEDDIVIVTGIPVRRAFSEELSTERGRGFYGNAKEGDDEPNSGMEKQGTCGAAKAPEKNACSSWAAGWGFFRRRRPFTKR